MLFDNPETSRIFVFGSNMSGRHGKGAALHAKEHYGAIQGKGCGLTGKSYAIPTKGYDMKTLSLENIGRHIANFEYDLMFYQGGLTPKSEFNITQIGCGLAGYDPQQIAPLFREMSLEGCPCWFDPAWKKWLSSEAKFWRHPI